MGWLKRILLGLGALSALAMLVAYLMPLDAYIPEVERALSGQLREPVRIRHLRLALLPLPHLELQEVHMGGQEGIAAQSVEVMPDLPKLLSGEVLIQRIVVREGAAHFAQVRKMAGLFADNLPASKVPVRELQLSGMSLVFPEMVLGPVEGKLEFTPAGQLKQAWFALMGQKVTLTLLPQAARRFALVVQAQDWIPPQFTQLPLDGLLLVGVLSERDFTVQRFSATSRGAQVNGSGTVSFIDGWHADVVLGRMSVPLERLLTLLEVPMELTGALSLKGRFEGDAGSLIGLKDNLRFTGEAQVKRAQFRVATGFRRPLVFDEIRTQVVLQPDHFRLSRLAVKLYGGSMTGEMKIDHKSATLAAELVASGIAMGPLVEAFSNDVLLSGNLESALALSMRLNEVEQFPRNINLSGNFHLRDGQLSRVDLAQAAGSASQGGMTRFDDLTGLLYVDADGYHFRKIKIVSGTLDATGNIDISPSLQLSGGLEANIRGTGGLVSLPLIVSGRVEEPIVRPSRSAMAGAAMGTAILGPGLGTALGIKLGNFLNKLFGKDGAKNDDKEAVPVPPARR